MNGWPLKIELWFASLGRWPLVLGALAVLVLLVWGTVVPVTEKQSAAALHQLHQLQSLRDREADTPAVAPAAAADPMAAFDARVASSDDVTQLMLQLWEKGAAAGLQMNKVDYRVESDTGAGFERLAITLPMTGAYPAVRKFTFSLMAEFPGLSLDKLDMKREQTASGRVETTVHLTLLTRP